MGSLADVAVKQMVTRIQILVTLLIEAGTPIDIDDYLSRWTVFFLYNKKEVGGPSDQSSYEFVGYSTVYRFFPFKKDSASPGSDPLNADLAEFTSLTALAIDQLPCRTRISQFIILPPYQGKGNAGRLYSSIFDHYYRDPQTMEITVEDPNEAFDDLRDMSDLAFLRKIPEFAALNVDTSIEVPKSGPAPRNIVDRKTLEDLRQKTKIAPRQYSRVVEMHLMSKLPASVQPRFTEPDAGKTTASKSDEFHYRLWKLFVKQRLYRHNKAMLGQLSQMERIEALDKTLESVETEYARLLEKFTRQVKLAESAAPVKRKLADANGEPSSKRARVENA